MYLRSTSSHPARPYFMRLSGVAIRLITGGSRFKSWRAPPSRTAGAPSRPYPSGSRRWIRSRGSSKNTSPVITVSPGEGTSTVHVVPAASTQ